MTPLTFAMIPLSRDSAARSRGIDPAMAAPSMLDRLRARPAVKSMPASCGTTTRMPRARHEAEDPRHAVLLTAQMRPDETALGYPSAGQT